MSAVIEVPVGGIIKVYGSEMVCVEDFQDANGIYIACGACPIKNTPACGYLKCGGVHFEYYYR